MSAARKIWQDAKAKIKEPKDWEARLRLRDDFGPNLDVLDKLASDLAEKIKAIEGELGKIEQLAKQPRLRWVPTVESCGRPCRGTTNGTASGALWFRG